MVFSGEYKIGTLAKNGLIHFRSIFHFYTPWKHHKTRDFVMFSRDIEMEHWCEIDDERSKVAIHMCSEE